MGWKGKRSAWIAIIGFLAALFTYFGVNYHPRRTPQLRVRRTIDEEDPCPSSSPRSGWPCVALALFLAAQGADLCRRRRLQALSQVRAAGPPVRHLGGEPARQVLRQPEHGQGRRDRQGHGRRCTGGRARSASAATPRSRPRPRSSRPRA
ncbi:MAG: cytochrome c biogenesis protein [Candidatus Moduliflexus flocculans]|nr:cytochrome c biogenesis protein [Candidatus Moduliflexus flocculans]